MYRHKIFTIHISDKVLVNRNYLKSLQLNKKTKTPTNMTQDLKRHFIIEDTSSVQSLSHDDSLRPHEPQHAKPPCPSPAPGTSSNSCPLSHWCHEPSHPLLSPSPPAFNLSQHQGLFKWVSSSHQVAKELEFQFQHQSFQWIFRTDFL